MDVLARELRNEAPDLAAQFAASRPTVRRNSGFGFFTEVLVPPERPASGPTGEFGTAHVLVAGLADPVAFRVRLRNGRMLGLLGDSYGQDTRSIDFAAVPFDQVFTVDSAGRSVPAEAVPDAGRSPAVQTPRPPSPPPPPAPVLIRPPADLEAPPRPAPAPEPAPSPHAAADLSEEDRTTLRVGLWAGLFALGSVLVLVFDLPIPAAFIAAVVAGRFLQTDRGLDLLRRTLASLQQAARERQA